MKHTVTEISLGNGSKGLLVHIPDASVMTFELNFRAGEYLLDRNKWETAHLMEHILLGANEAYPTARAFVAEVEKNGAYSNASTSVYDINYEAECADFEWDRILGLLVLAITKPLFLENEFNSEVGIVQEELTTRSNNHFRHLALALREQYGMYSMTDQERLRLMSNVTVEDVRAHYLATHTTDNMRFVIAGNITTERRLAIEKILSTIELPKGSGRRPMPEETPKSLQKPLYIEVPGVENLYFYIDTFMSRWMRNTEIDALSLANIMLTETSHSRIYGTGREKGLLYHMNSFYTRWQYGSNWWFGAQILPQNTRQLFDIITREITGIRQGHMSDEDIVAAKQHALGRFQRSAQTVGGTGNGYSMRYFFDDVIEDYYEVPKRLEAVTKEQMISVTNDLFSEGIRGFGVLGTCGEEFAQDCFSHIKGLWNT
ncbi:insulinase family protein [Candidatus Saccharibacteria bacterium]|nr:insulinase family protein [Candidatus Saccharibacteria bacterium]MCA9337613.1 insulinase family protein [Candidatus Saccharibacteria bacterium]